MGDRSANSGKSGGAAGGARNIQAQANINTGMTEEQFYEAIERANEEGDKSLFPRLPGSDGAYVYEGSGGSLYVYDPKNPMPDFSESARISKKQLKFEKATTTKAGSSSAIGTKLTYPGGWTYTKTAANTWVTYHNGKRQKNRSDADINQVFS